MRRRWIWVLLAMVVLAVLAWLTWPVGTGDERPSPVPPPPSAALPAPAPPPARAELPAPGPASAAPVREAIEAVAAASGRYVVSCPPMAPIPEGGRRDTQLPPGSTCATTGELLCAVSQPSGTTVVREHAEVTLPDGSVSSKLEGVYTLRWDTGPDGVTRCQVEAPTPGQIAVRVVDASGAPLASVAVLANDRAEATGPDGWARLPVLTAGVVEVMAFGSDGGVSRPASVTAGGEATLVLGPPPADLGPEAVLAEVRLARNVESMADIEDALAEERRPEVAAELQRLLDGVRASVEAVCGSSSLPSCPAGASR